MGEGPDPVETVRRLFDLLAKGHQSQILPLLHEDAVIVPRVGRVSALVGPVEIAAWARAMSDGAMLNHVIADSIERIDHDRFVVYGRLTWAVPLRGVVSEPTSYAIQTKDGLIWRSKSVLAPEDAFLVHALDDWSSIDEDEQGGLGGER